MKYLMQRGDSTVWRIRLQTPGKPVYERPLGTRDKRQAEIIALRDHGDKIAAHKAALLALRPRLETSWQRQYEPGLHDGPNSERIAATDRELSFYNADGRFLRVEPNGGPAEQVVGDGKLTLRALVEAHFPRPVAPDRSDDDALFQVYLDHGGKKRTGIHGYSRREAEATWALFRQLTNGKPLAQCTRNDGRLLVRHFQAEGDKSATIAKKITWLNSAVNFAIKEGRFNSINPFSSIAPDGDDKEKRLPLSDADVTACKENLGKLDKHGKPKLSPEDQLLFRLLGTTGMRLSEAFQIVGEEPHGKGPRFVIIGRKTSQSQRRVPFPADLLPHLPKAIKGKMFEGTAAAASKRLNRFLRAIEIKDPNKTLHSLRHRAEDRLRDADCPADIRWALLGHEDDTVAAGYGEGFSTAKLKTWIDEIGF